MSKKEFKEKSREEDQNVPESQDHNMSSKDKAADAKGVEEDKTKDEKAELMEEVQKEKENFLRLFAEFENYKKRTSRERIELFSTANRELMTALLPVLDTA